MVTRWRFVGFLALLAAVLIFGMLVRSARYGVIPDDAKSTGKTPADFPESASRAYDATDGGIPLTDEEVEGRNTWLFWTAGDEAFWDYMAQHGFGTTDLLKTIDSRRRTSRFKETGLVNEPAFVTASVPDLFGLWVDQPITPHLVQLDPAVYGRSTGIVGLRLFPNPQFDDVARKRWDAARYYSDPNYYNDPRLIRPYRVGMSCGFCHVAFNPESPPVDPENPGWDNLSSTIGNQYLKASHIFLTATTADNFVYQVLDSWAPGTIDTSFLASDNLDNPGNMNSIDSLPARLAIAHEEDISGGALHLPGERRRMAVPHVLKDGADSVGIYGALSRVYVSIGAYSQEWLRDHDVLIGARRQRPFEIVKAQQGSVYWQATTARLPKLAAFLMKMKSPRLASAPGGVAWLTHNDELLNRGKIVFAENCARCHSSKQPPAALKTPEQYFAWMRSEVLRPDFLDNNFLSTDDRIPVTLVQTNAARSLATNAMRGHVWDNFSSDTYKSLPSPGQIQVLNPINGSAFYFSVPPGGPGYYRVPSLAGIWASAPFLHNNALGSFIGDPSVAGRMKAFDDAIEKLLWPGRRSGTASIRRTTRESFLEIPSAYLPEPLRSVAAGGYFRIGPIPESTPIDLLANADLDLSAKGRATQRIKLIVEIKSALERIHSQHLDPAAARIVLTNLVPDLLKLSKCPDFVEDRGHYFGTELSDHDKFALIEFLKTF